MYLINNKIYLINITCQKFVKQKAQEIAAGEIENKILANTPLEYQVENYIYVYYYYLPNTPLE